MFASTLVVLYRRRRLEFNPCNSISLTFRKGQQQGQKEKKVYDLSVMEMNGVSLVALTANKTKTGQIKVDVNILNLGELTL